MGIGKGTGFFQAFLGCREEISNRGNSQDMDGYTWTPFGGKPLEKAFPNVESRRLNHGTLLFQN